MIEKQKQQIFKLYARHNKLLNPLMELKKQSNHGESKKSHAPMADDVTFDDLLVAIGQTRNRDAFIRVYEYFAPRVKSFLMQGGFNPESADELAQETMLTVWNKAKSYNPQQAAASTWIFTIARNKKIDMLRKTNRPALKAEDLAMQINETDMPDDVMATQQESKALEKAIKTLPEEQAMLLRKSFFEDKTHNVIAEETGIPLGTVKSRIRLALDRLRYNMGAKTS